LVYSEDIKEDGCGKTDYKIKDLAEQDGIFCLKKI
jgi:hypothetical protein